MIGSFALAEATYSEALRLDPTSFVLHGARYPNPSQHYPYPQRPYPYPNAEEAVHSARGAAPLP
jgi:hypothetical protein